VTPRITAITKKLFRNRQVSVCPYVKTFRVPLCLTDGPFNEIAAVVMAPPAARKPPGKGKTPKPDLRKRKTGKKKDEDGNPDAEPKETAEVRLVETRAAPAPT